ncbi:Secretory carrier-associated membrane protein 2 [Homalodisca vitripennis]|nr:Secretory carrier-associated membrane protein 2 [Homalodisca vitripennis]
MSARAASLYSAARPQECCQTALLHRGQEIFKVHEALRSANHGERCTVLGALSTPTNMTLHSSLMVLNVFGGLLLFLHTHQFGTFGVGVIYAILFTPFSFVCWYRPVYKAFRLG